MISCSCSLLKMGEENGIRRAHVLLLLLPLPAQGHINPMVCIAHFLAGFDIVVTLALAARSHSLLMSSAAGQNLLGCKNIRVDVLPDGLPADPKQLVSKEAVIATFGTIRQGAHDLLHRLLDQADPTAPPCCVIADSFLIWAPDLACLFGLPHVPLWCSAISNLSVGIHIPEIMARGCLPITSPDSRHMKLDFIPGLASLCPADLPPMFLTEEALQSDAFQLVSQAFKQAKHAERVLVNSFYELESAVVDSLRMDDGVHIDPIAPLFMINPSGGSSASLLDADRSCLSWLDQQEEASVLYISFGSESNIHGGVYEELASGLELASEVRFLWVIRPGELITSAADKAVTLEELLPQGFLQRTAKRGVVISWAPQLEVLAHASVGAFLTHCGWNSVLESLSYGVPMLGFPHQVDQSSNLKLIVQEWKVGLPLLSYEQKEQQQPLNRSHVRASVMAIMQGEEAESLRKCALKWRDAAQKSVSSHDGGGSSYFNLKKLANDLKSGHFKRELNERHKQRFILLANRKLVARFASRCRKHRSTSKRGPSGISLRILLWLQHASRKQQNFLTANISQSEAEEDEKFLFDLVKLKKMKSSCLTCTWQAQEQHGSFSRKVW